VVPGNIRELEGAVLKTVGYASLMSRTPDLALVREILRTDKASVPRGVVTCGRIQDVVGRWFGVSPADLQAKTRARSVAFPRQVAMHLARQLTSKSLEEIGGAFGNRDHSTVAHACDRIAREIQADPQFNATLETLIRQIKAE
jgi:chromosomal replication initiator protein